jgi:hypothetical protein
MRRCWLVKIAHEVSPSPAGTRRHRHWTLFLQKRTSRPVGGVFFPVLETTCLVGAWALSLVRPRWTALPCTWEGSLPWIRRVSAVEKRALEGVARAPGPRLISIRGDYPTWRLVSYYFPEDWIRQSNFTAHANRVATNTPPQDLRSQLVINEQGEVSIK